MSFPTDSFGHSIDRVICPGVTNNPPPTPVPRSKFSTNSLATSTHAAAPAIVIFLGSPSPTF